MTIVKTSDKLKNLNDVVKKYEVELELFNSKKKLDDEIKNIIIDEINVHLKVFE